MTLDVHAAAQQAAEFHGHMCPGLAIGVRAAELALDEIGPHSKDEEVVSVVETDMWAVDAIQSLTGCTYGKGNLIHRDYGKNAFTFYRRSDGRGLRLASRPNAFGPRSPESDDLSKRVRSGQGTEDDQRAFDAMQQQRTDRILSAPLQDLFVIQPVEQPVPKKARIHTSLVCDRCGEQAMETRVRHFGGQTLCLPCFDRLEARV